MIFVGEITRDGRAAVWKLRNSKELGVFALASSLHRSDDGPVSLDALRKSATQQNRDFWAYETAFELAAAPNADTVPAALVAPFAAELARVQAVAMRPYQPPKP